MQFTESPRRQAPENMVPMINVVFLLLIFFLMTAQIAPPEPFEVNPPATADQEEPIGPLTLFVDAGGQLGFGDVVGAQGALAALTSAIAEACATQACDDGVIGSVQLRADRAVPVAELARLLPQIGAAGAGKIELVTVAQ